jgi:hypothetical protein
MIDDVTPRHAADEERRPADVEGHGTRPDQEADEARREQPTDSHERFERGRDHRVRRGGADREKGIT